MQKRRYQFSAAVWIYPGVSGWHFLSVPKKLSAEIKKTFSAYARGWGSLPVAVTIGKTMWQTSIFPDAKSNTYLLPLKAVVRKKEHIFVKETVVCILQIDAKRKP
jgi:hypothetical protein